MVCTVTSEREKKTVQSDRCMSLQPPPFSAAFGLGLSCSARLVLSKEPTLEFGAVQEPEKSLFECMTYVVFVIRLCMNS